MSKKKEKTKLKGFNISHLTVDDEKQGEGVWFPFKGGLKLKVASLTKPAYEEEIRKRGKPYRSQIRQGGADSEAILEITRKAIVNHILLDWENLIDYVDGEEKLIPFSKDKALEYLTKHREFYDMVVECANDAESFRKEYMEDMEGNLGAA